MTKGKGKLIVIDGPDATGKKTQSRLLFERLQKEGLPAKLWSFPQYDNLSSAAIWLYLQRHAGKPFLPTELEDIQKIFGQNLDRVRERLWEILVQITPSPWGDSSKLDPYAASLFYAIDRAAARQAITNDLEEGRYCISDRYVSANLIHQGSKIEDPEMLRPYLRRMRELEYDWLNIPKPDLNILLHLPPAIRRSFQEKRQESLEFGNAPDAHERDFVHQERAHRMCETLAALFPEDFTLIECAQNGHPLPPQEVCEKIWAAVKPVL